MGAQAAVSHSVRPHKIRSPTRVPVWALPTVASSVQATVMQSDCKHRILLDPALHLLRTALHHRTWRWCYTVVNGSLGPAQAVHTEVRKLLARIFLGCLVPRHWKES